MGANFDNKPEHGANFDLVRLHGASELEESLTTDSWSSQADWSHAI